MRLTRRIRGIVGTTAVWATLFAVAGVAGLAPLWLFGVLPPFEPTRFGLLLGSTIVRWGMGGAAMGLLFATTVVSLGRRRSLDSLSPLRFAIWGFVAGASVPLCIALVVATLGESSPATGLRAAIVFGGISGVLGAALAVASLRAARGAHNATEHDSRVRATVI